MRVAVTAQGPDLTSPVDPYFGRARYLLVVDAQSGEFSAHDNGQNVHAAHGAGIQTARVVVGLGVDAVITGNVGHKAFGALQTSGIRVYRKSSGTVRDAVEESAMGKLETIGRASVFGHWREVP